MARVNFKATSQDFTPLPNASYPIEVESAEMKQSSKGNPMLKMTYKVLGEVPEGCSKKLFDQFVLVPQSGWVLKNFLEAAQVPHQAVPGPNRGEYDIDFDTQDMIGKLLIARTEQETYQKQVNGKPQLDENGQPVMGIRNTIAEYLKAA